MATKIIKAWIDGAIQDIEVEDIALSEYPLSVDERVDVLEDKHEVVITDGNLLVGNGTADLEEMTPEEVLSHINGASVMTMTTKEYEALGDENSNANTLYVLTDDEDPEYALQSDFESLQDVVEQKSQVQIVTSTETENLTENISILQIHKLTEEQYQQAIESGDVDENALYLTPDEEIDLTPYATIEYVDGIISNISPSEHNHNDIYYTETEIDEKVSAINTSISSVATEVTAEAKSYADNGDATTLEASKMYTETYTDNAVAQKSQVQIITWEDDD